MTLTHDLDITYVYILSHSSVHTGQNISKVLHKLVKVMASLQMQKISLAACMNSIYEYIIFSAVSRKHIFGHNVWVKKQLGWFRCLGPCF